LHCNTFVEPARQAKLEVPAAELMPSLMCQHGKSAFDADIVSNASAFMTIRAGLYPAEDFRLLAREVIREILPLPAVGEKINGEPGFCLDRCR